MARFMDFHQDLKLPAEARQHHAALGVPCGEVHQVDWLTWPGRIEESRREPASETASSWRRSERAWTAGIVQSLPLRRSPSLR
ncbi:MAG: hypothetical protein WAL13_27170 [Trebonia sp.]